MSFVAELKRRNIHRTAAAYLFIGWLTIEIAGLMLPGMGFPDSATRGLILAIFAGILPVLLLAWQYEVTPAGIVRDDGSGRNAAENTRTGRRLEQVSVVVALLVVAMVGIKRFVLPEVIELAPAPVASTAPPAASPAAPVVPALPIDPRSIAVMAFANLSPDPANEYFADGISEELLNVLAKIDGLKVASRTSAFSFKGKDVSIREIGRALGVAHVLEGSVRMHDDKVRITAQLIDTSNDQHLWSDTYDRTLDDIFKVQEEIAGAITAALKNVVGAQTISVERPTHDLAAWEQFLKARPLYFQRGNVLFTARDLLNQSVERDPQFAQAWALLAATHYVMPSYFGTVDADAAADAARDAAGKALALEDSQSIAWAVLAMLAADRGDRLEARKLMQKAQQADPNNSTAWLWSGIIETQGGHLESARTSFEHARALDPLVGINNSWLGMVTVMQGKVEEGKALLSRSRELGSVGDPLWAFIQIAAAEGPSDKLAQQLRDYLPQDPVRPATQQGMWNAVADALADPAKRPAALEAINVSIAVHPAERHSEALQILGYHHEAIAEELRVTDGYSDFMSRIWYPQDKPLREDPLYLELAAKRGLLAEWKANGFPDNCKLGTGSPARLECSR